MNAIDLADTIRAAEGNPKLERKAMAAATPAAREQYTDAMLAYRQFAEVDYLHDAVLHTKKPTGVIESASAQARANLLWVLEETDPLDAASRLRSLRLAYMRENPEQVLLLIRYYAMGNIADFISDWATATDPRRANRGRSTTVPFLLFKRQIEMCEYLWRIYRTPGGAHGAVPKAREIGATQTSISFVTALALLVPGFVAIVGSALERDIDFGQAESLFSKIRDFLAAVPEEFRAGYTLEKCSTNMRVILPATGASIIGQAGDNIGRGKRASMVLLDEFAFVERAHLVKEAVSATSRVVVSISSVNGVDNQFYRDCHSPGIEPFYFRWTDDDRVDPDTGKRLKTREWYEQQVETLGTLIVAQTLDCDWLASISGACIPTAHIQACVGLAKRLGIEPRGALRVAYDPAGNSGQGDRYGYAVMHGTHVVGAATWTGLGSTESLQRVYSVLDDLGATELFFDVHGVGDHTPAEMQSLEALRGDGRPKYRPNGFNSNRYQKMDKKGDGVLFRPLDPLYGTKYVPHSRGTLMADIFGNYRAQAWGHLAWLAKNSYEVSARFAAGGDVSDVDPATLLFIDETIPELSRLITDLGQPAFRQNSAMLKFVEKGTPSPTLGDCIMMASAPRDGAMKISDTALAAVSRGGFYASY